jgi:hypothetical protein
VRGDVNVYSDYSNIVNATTIDCPPLSTPPTPTLVSAERIRITFTWLSDGLASHIYVERRINGGEWAFLAKVNAQTTSSYTDGNLMCNTPYDYRMQYYRDEDGDVSDYSDALLTSTSACPPPVIHTVGVYQDGRWMFSPVNAPSAPDVSFIFGPRESGWTALVGAWNGDGVDGIGLYKAGLFLLRSNTASGVVDRTFRFGLQEPGWQPLVGDWNGDGIDTIGQPA